MTLKDRDKKILMVLVPLVLVGAFAFLVMKPKLQDSPSQERLPVALALLSHVLSHSRKPEALAGMVIRAS